MDELLLFLESFRAGDFVDCAELRAYLDRAHSTKDEQFTFDEDDYRRVQETLGDVKSLGIEDAFSLLGILLPQLKSTYIGDQTHAAVGGDAQPGYVGNIIDDEPDGARAVPDAATDAPGPLDSYSRRRTSPIRRNPLSSTAEGARLRGRNLAAMTNADYDALAGTIQPSLANEIASYAAHAGIGPPAAAAAEPASLDDLDQSGFSTPHVSRAAIRQRMRAVARAQPHAGAGPYDVPISPESSSHDLRSPLRSPTRYAELDDGSRQHIEELLSKKAELQKAVAEKTRRIELIESQYEKRTVSLERDIDECKAQLTTKKREIERLKQAERSCAENLRVAEGEIERIGVSLSNSTAQAAELRRQLDTKTAQLDESNQRVLSHQAEIVGLKADLGANHQQQDQLARDHRRLELQFRELQHELKAARELRDEAAAVRKENLELGETIDALKQELADLRLRDQQRQQSAGADDQGAAQQPGLRRRYRSLRDELEDSDSPAKSAAGGADSADSQELRDAAVRQWISAALARCSAEDLVLLSEVWRRIEYCDAGTDAQARLRRELIDVFAAPCKHGLKEAIRGRSNPTLARIVDSVAGEYGARALPAGKGAKGLAQVLASGQYTVAAVVLYSVVIFCLGIITASYFGAAQPGMAAPGPFSAANGTAQPGMPGVVRQILVVDDTPAYKHYTPLRKRTPRSRLGEMLFYWAETLLWDDSDAPVPT
ncbi:hypothetical protein H4R18_004231 [Coemansia javaensis]|uniref:Uncharacterized protein n=1 Tax=Coemansia javaensis TaxID=2761396 RepID=A0A9W8H4U4_9FUNG|nr:hypothetical protein H4R18_004231 [Coemansia javaensis]